MTPRVDISWVDVGGTSEELLVEFGSSLRGRGMPVLVCEADIEHVLGVVYADDLLQRSLNGVPLDLRATLTEALFVPESMPVLSLLESFRRSRHQAAIALDEYGGVAGVATLDDILEALVGELPQHGKSEALEIVRQSDGSWLVDGGTAVDDLGAFIDFESSMEESRRDSITVGGLVMATLGHLPREGEHVNHSGARFTIAHMQGRRIDQVRIQLLPRNRTNDE